MIPQSDCSRETTTRAIAHRNGDKRPASLEKNMKTWQLLLKASFRGCLKMLHLLLGNRAQTKKWVRRDLLSQSLRRGSHRGIDSWPTPNPSVPPFPSPGLGWVTRHLYIPANGIRTPRS